MNPRMRIASRKLLVMVIAWMAVSLLVTCYDYFALQSDIAAGFASDYSFRRSLLFNLAAATLGALLGGPFLIFYINEKFRHRPYGHSLIRVSIYFVFLVTLITLVLAFWVVWDKTGHWPYFVDEATVEYHKFLMNPLHIKNSIIWFNVTLLTQFLIQMDDKFGPGLLWSFIVGKYNTPRKEERVFMFLDLKDSTRIAEQLGNEGYHALLRDFFSDITNSIIHTQGRIYQYVGDEVVVSWDMKAGKKNQQCIKCFFDAKQKIDEKKALYNERYNLVPKFKAAMHCGSVTVGEIGVIKRDITYSGDVLNTTARIMGRCNSLGKELLISSKLYHYIDSELTHYSFKEVGDEQLRGKIGKVKMYGVDVNVF